DPRPNTTPPLADAPPGPWIVVDRAATSLTFVKDGKPQFVTYVSLGRAGVDTPTGQYSTFGKYKADDMTSTSVANADHTYDLPNVPFTQYYREAATRSTAPTGTTTSAWSRARAASTSAGPTPATSSASPGPGWRTRT